MYFGNFYMEHGGIDVFAANNTYTQMSKSGFWYRLWARIRRQPYTLWSLKAMSQQWRVRGRRSLGLRRVPLNAIKGSEGKANAFDSNFRPLRDEQSRDRWMSIALARQKGKSLPPVALIQVNDGCSPIYFVRDGHHRISVARAFGQEEIEANVIVWQLDGPAPWSTCITPPQPALATL